MNIIRSLEYKPKLSLALGFFDGLHQGHKVVIKTAVNYAKQNNVESGIIIFKDHPLSYILQNSIKQIITLEDKIEMLEALEVENVILLDFDESIAHLSASNYLKDILIKNFEPVAITTGFNHHFGHNRQGNSDFLKMFQSKYNYRYFEVPPITCRNVVASSSSIRNALTCGNLDLANSLLGYNFFIRARVIQGQKLGRKIDFPTANFVYPEKIIEVPTGVYLVEVEVKDKTYRGMLNYGYRPTVSAEAKITSEVHILDFHQDIYDEEIKVSFITKIRNEMKFRELSQLKGQIIKDLEFARTFEG